MKKFSIGLLLVALLLCMTGCGKSEAVKNVEALISSIGQVSLESEDAIVKAEGAYEALPAEEKSDVKSYTELQEARAAYDKLVEEAEALAKREEAINDVKKLISEITAVDIKNLAKIERAKKAYDALPDEDKAKVEKGGELANMVKQVESIKKAEGQKLLSKMRLESDEVRDLKFYYPSAFKFYSDGSWAADVRSFILPYIGQSSDSAWLRLIYNYTGDDWVFFKSIIVNADGKRFYKTFNYFDIVHDNGGGDVWEYMDDEVSESDIEMLWAIAESDKTIVRFQGDDYSEDYTVSAGDKKAIKDVLLAYEAIR